MTPLVLAHFGATHPDDLVHAIYDGALKPSAIAAVARAVQAAADGGDELALQILTVGARELASSARSSTSTSPRRRLNSANYQLPTSNSQAEPASEPE